MRDYFASTLNAIRGDLKNRHRRAEMAAHVRAIAIQRQPEQIRPKRGMIEAASYRFQKSTLLRRGLFVLERITPFCLKVVDSARVNTLWLSQQFETTADWFDCDQWAVSCTHRRSLCCA